MTASAESVPNRHDDVGNLDRRTLTTGAAWSIPVVAVGALAPAVAASATDCRIAVRTRARVTSQNGADHERYSIAVRVNNTGATSVALIAQPPAGGQITDGQTQVVPPGVATDWWINFTAPRARIGKRMTLAATWRCGSAEIVVPATGLTAP